MKRILFVATVASHIKAFHLPFINLLKEKGYEVEVACHLDIPLNDLKYVWEIPFSRSPYSIDNIRAFKSLRRLIQERNYHLIHVHTPVAAFLVRLAARKMNIPVLYTAHGFHFWKGAPIINHLLYKTAEYIAAPWTAGLIVINREDFEAARTLGFREGENLFCVHGVGVDLDYYKSTDEGGIEIELEIGPEVPVALCIGELNSNKNQSLLIDAWKYVRQELPNARLLFVGEGELRIPLMKRVFTEGLWTAVHFLGYRTDIPRLLARANVVTLVSKREGLPRCLMEAMAAGKPVVATDVRGSRDLVKDGVNGFLVPLGKPRLLARALVRVLGDKELAARMGQAGTEMIREYSLDRVLEEMWAVYRRYLQP